MKAHWNVVALFLVGAIAFTLAACESEPPPLRTALLEWPPYELAFWARHNQWLDDDKVQLLEYKTPAEVTRAFSTGAVDIIAVTTDFAISLMPDNPDTRIFLIIDSSNGGDTVLSRTALTPASDLRGLKIAVEAGPLGSYMMARFRQKFDLDENDLEITYVDIPGQVHAWQNNGIDLLITYEPNRSRLMAAGAQEIFSSRDIPNEIVDVFLVREELLTQRKEQLRHFIAGWFRAVESLHRRDPALFEFAAAREAMSPAAMIAAFETVHVPGRSENLELLGNSGNNSFKMGLRLNQAVMLADGVLEEPVAIDQLTNIDASALMQQ